MPVDKTGYLATRIAKEPELHNLFGDGYRAGNVAEVKQPEDFLALLREG